MSTTCQFDDWLNRLTAKLRLFRQFAAERFNKSIRTQNTFDRTFNEIIDKLILELRRCVHQQASLQRHIVGILVVPESDATAVRARLFRAQVPLPDRRFEPSGTAAVHGPAASTGCLG